MDTFAEQPGGGLDKGIRYYTRAEVALHNVHDDAWVSLFGKVYDITPIIKNHKGDTNCIQLLVVGRTRTYRAEEMMEREKRIGVLEMDNLNVNEQALLPFHWRSLLDKTSHIGLIPRHKRFVLTESMIDRITTIALKAILDTIRFG